MSQHIYCLALVLGDVLRDLVSYWGHDLQIRVKSWLDDNTITKETSKIVRKQKLTWEEYFKQTGRHHHMQYRRGLLLPTCRLRDHPRLQVLLKRIGHKCSST